MDEKTVYALFQNARQVIQADQTCRKATVRVRVVPVPEQISSECGMCLQFEKQFRPKVETVLAQLPIIVSFYEPE